MAMTSPAVILCEGEEHPTMKTIQSEVIINSLSNVHSVISKQTSVSSERTRTDDVDDGVKPGIGFGEVICFVIDDRISTDRVHEIDVFCTANCGYGSSKYFCYLHSESPDST